MGLFQKHQIGNVELIALQDSWMSMPPGMVFSDVSASDWDNYKEFLNGDGNLTLNIGSWLVRSEGKTILVDTGLGAWPNEMPTQEDASLPSVLKAAGVQPDEIDVVAFSHFHPDHTGWNTDPSNGGKTPTFANARHVAQQVEWDHWTSSDALKEGSRYAQAIEPIEQAGLWDLVEGEHALTSEVVSLPTPGHTPGHVSFVVSSGGEKAYLITDAAHIPAQLSETDWSIDFDTDKSISRQTRHSLFDRIEADGALIASGHFPYPGLGHVIREGGKRLFKAI